jgi:hypothetical protein
MSRRVQSCLVPSMVIREPPVGKSCPVMSGRVLSLSSRQVMSVFASHQLESLVVSCRVVSGHRHVTSCRGNRKPPKVCLSVTSCQVGHVL